jgi:hypothetical protein
MSRVVPCADQLRGAPKETNSLPDILSKDVEFLPYDSSDGCPHGMFQS